VVSELTKVNRRLLYCFDIIRNVVQAAPDRHFCLVFNDLKLKSKSLFFKVSQCLWTGIIDKNKDNVKRFFKEL